MKDNQEIKFGSLYEDEKTKNTAYIMNSLSKLNNENSLVVTLDKQMKSTELSDDIYHSYKKFVIINRYCVLKMYSISLIAYIDYLNQPTNSVCCCSMSQFKETGRRVLWGNDLEYIPKKCDTYCLYEQILKIPTEKIIPDAILPFEYPILVSGQLSDDRKGFGVYPDGRNKRYGDCSLQLHIIGIKVD